MSARQDQSTTKSGSLNGDIADMFNMVHLSQLEHDGYGYGGKIIEKHVDSFLRQEGSKIIQGDLGVLPVSQLMVPHLGMTLPMNAPGVLVPNEQQQQIWQ